jgi:hypothetical protein
VQDSTRAADDRGDRARTLVLPIVSYSETTGLQFGATLFRSFVAGGGAETRPSSDAIYVARTTKRYTKAHAQTDRWSPDNGRHVRLRAEHISYPLPYFGIGPSTPDSAEEWYSTGVSTLHTFVEARVRSGAWVHAGYRLIHARRREVEPDGELVAGAVTGAHGGMVSEVRLGVTHDTRLTTVAPAQGTYARLIASAAGPAIGSDFRIGRVTLDARRYGALGRGFTAAMQVQLDVADGNVPFDLLPMIGADTAMRGYPRGRYRDRSAVTTQVELRTPYWRRAGLVVFAGAGAVAPRVDDLASVPWRPSVGAGLRLVYSPRDRSTARLDFGIGRGSFGVSVGLGEAF